MLRIFKKVIVGLWGAVTLALGFVVLNGSLSQKAVGQVSADVRSALPAQAELSNFDKYHMTAFPKGAKMVDAVRHTDRLSFSIEVFVAPTEAEAQRITHDGVYHWHQVAMLPGTPLGRKIGQEVWHTYRNGADNMGIIALDGRSSVSVTLALPVPTDAHGKPILVHGRPVRGHLSQADLQLAENHVLKALDKLTAMGYTSRSATSRAHRPLH